MERYLCVILVYLQINYIVMKPITKKINNKFNPTYFNPYLFKYGGRMKYDIGGMMMPGGMLDMSQEIPQVQAMSQGTPGIGQAASFAGNTIGSVADAITSANNDKPYARKSVVGGIAKGAGQGAAAGMTLGPIGAGIGAALGAGAGALTTALGNKSAQNNYQSQLTETNTKRILGNLPSAPQYVPTFAGGGVIAPWNRESTFGNENYSDDGIKMLLRDERKTPDWFTKASGKANLTDSPIDWVIGGAPMMDMSKGLWHLGDLAATKIVDDAGGIIANAALKGAAVGGPSITAANLLDKKADGGPIPNDKLWLNNWVKQRPNVLQNNLMDSSLKSFYQNNPDGVNNLIKSSTSKMMSTPETFSHDFGAPDTLGSTVTDLNTGKSQIRYRDANPESTVKVHELNHALRLDPYISNSINKLTQGKVRQDVPEYRKNALDYYTAPNEVHSRLMEIRRANELNPKATYSPEEVGKMRQSNFGGAKDWKEINALYELYDDETISNLLNGIVSNQLESTTVAANGGVLPINQRVTSFDNGGLHSENGGIPVGQNSMVERGEYMYTNKEGKKYIFTNNF